MASTANNNIVREVRPGSIVESAKPFLSASVSWNQGDLLYLDTTAHQLKPIALTIQAASVLGVARQTVVNGSVKSPYNTDTAAAQAIEDLAGPAFGVVASLKLKSGDVFNPGVKVYATVTDPQTVTVTDPLDGAYIGIFQGAAITAAAGSKGDVLCVAQYPGLAV